MGQDRPCLVSWGQRLQESSWQEKETKNNPERESPERGTGKWGVEGRWSREIVMLPSQPRHDVRVHRSTHTAHTPTQRAHNTHKPSHPSYTTHYTL